MSVSDFSITTGSSIVMQASSDANGTGTSSAMPSSNMAGTPNDQINDPLLGENSNFDNNNKIPQAVTGSGLQPEVPGGNNVVPSASVSDLSITTSSTPVMQVSSDANGTGTSSAMPSSNAAGTLDDPMQNENLIFDNNTEISQAVAGPGLPVPVGSYSGSGTALLPDLLSATVTGNSNTALPLNLVSASDKPLSLSTERSTNACDADMPTLTGLGNSNMSGGVGGKKPSKMRPGNTLTPRYVYFTIHSKFASDW